MNIQCTNIQHYDSVIVRFLASIQLILLRTKQYSPEL
jgi:hypothetical protein